MSDYLVTAPATEPITLAELKAEIGQDATQGTAQDARLERMIKSARIRAEHLTQRAFITQTWGKALDSFPSAIELPRTPIISVTWVKYLDANGVLQTAAATDYVTELTGLTGYIVPEYGYTWPTTYPEINAVTVQYVAGYGAASAVPECVKDWMYLILRDQYDNPGAHVGTDIKENPFLDRMLDPITIIRV